MESLPSEVQMIIYRFLAKPTALCEDIQSYSLHMHKIMNLYNYSVQYWFKWDKLYYFKKDLFRFCRDEYSNVSIETEKMSNIVLRCKFEDEDSKQTTRILFGVMTPNERQAFFNFKDEQLRLH